MVGFLSMEVIDFPRNQSDPWPISHTLNGPISFLRSNNLEDVREEWERIKLSYEILSDKKMRQKYDRHAMLADPGAALGRAAFGAVGQGIMGLGQGIFSVGAFAAKQITKDR